MRYSLETRQLVLRRIFEQAPHHAKKLRQLARSNCTGFCKLFEFNNRISEGGEGPNFQDDASLYGQLACRRGQI